MCVSARGGNPGGYLMSHTVKLTNRLRENLKLVVRGTNANGQAFEEKTEAYDISESGISFYLSTPIWMNSHLTIEIASSSFWGPEKVMGALVVRINAERSRKQFIAARFD
jgi:hypothetical protein